MALADPVERSEIDTVRDRASGKIQNLSQPNAARLGSRLDIAFNQGRRRHAIDVEEDKLLA
ncbi:hypothetical protein QP164_02100 [Sphingomonas sp. LR59]|uniref:hypothetical protein n=1 Tax=Sphingomonas sp. LR59 TaxID=3050232 RepID=UPI002FE14537